MPTTNKTTFARSVGGGPDPGSVVGNLTKYSAPQPRTTLFKTAPQPRTTLFKTSTATQNFTQSSPGVGGGWWSLGENVRGCDLANLGVVT